MNGYILLCPNLYRDPDYTETANVAQFLGQKGFDVRYCLYNSEGVTPESPAVLRELQRIYPEDGFAGAGLAVSLGGDGTILHLSHILGGTGVPIIGMNLGNKGFLTDLGRRDYDKLLIAAEGNFNTEARMMLDVALLRDDKPVFHSIALNEAVVRASVSVIQLEANDDAGRITSFSGDGIIISGPTGSTAYSMAAGGPIVEPEASCFVLTPICAFRLAARSFVLSADREIFVRTVQQGNKQAIMSVDGIPVDFLEGDVLRVRRSEKTLMMAHIGTHGFYDLVYAKLNDVREKEEAAL